MIPRNFNYPNLTSFLICAACILISGYYYDIEFIKFNYGQAVKFVLSTHFLFFVAVGALLSRKWITDKWYNYLVFVSAALHSLIFYGNNLDVFKMAGDNVCQIAYWKILFHQNLVGSIGASFTKPGQLLILGVLYQLSLYVSPLLFKIGLSLVMAACIWSMIRVATDIGGRTAGIIAFPVGVWAFAIEFVSGSSSIFLIPTLFVGMWLYFNKPEHKSIGRMLIVMSIQFHIQTISVIGVIWLILLIKKEWKELGVFSLYSGLSVVLWVAIIYRVQGAMERLNSGVAVGYIGPLEGEPNNGFMYMFNILQDGLTSQPYIRLLMVLVVIGIIGAIVYEQKIYLIVFSSLLVLVVNVVILGGTFNLGRYCSTFFAFGCAVGIGTAVKYVNEIIFSKYLLSKIFVIVAVVLLIVSFDYTIFNLKYAKDTFDYDTGIECDYIVSARKLLSDSLMNESTRLMTEDDILYPLVIMDADRFSSLTALQYFNVSEVAVRKRMLANTDCIWIALNDGHPYYYLSHMPVPEWENDNFRVMIINILNTNQPASLYGFSFIPVDRNSDRLILRVVSESV